MIKHFGDQALSQVAIEKQSRLNQKVLEKRTDLDPNYIEFHPELWDVLDSDTIRHKITGENVRLTVGPGYSSDAWETDEKRYKLNPGRFKAHRDAYAAQFGKDPADVSMKDLVEAGKSQTYNMRENLMSLSGRGMGLTRTGTDDYGRTVAQFDDPSVLAPITGNQGNANYFSKYNWRQLREDRLNDFGALAKPDRSFLQMVGDQGNNLIYGGVLPIASSTIQGLGNIIGANNIEFVNEFFDYFNESVERTHDFFESDAQKAREKYDEKEKGLLRNLEQVRIDEYQKENPDAPAWIAHMAAGADSYVDRLEYLKENPGRIIDAGVESIPYMLGVGAVGRAVTIKATRKMADDFLEALTKKQIARPRYPVGTPGRRGGQFAANDDALRIYQNSPEYAKQLRKIQSNTGATVVGITEGLSNAGDVYTRVRNMTEEEAFQSEKYTQMRARGLTHKEAVTKLAKSAFNDVLVTSTIMAGLASKITGAAGFEARLFQPFQRKIPGIRPENRLYRWAQATGKTTGSFLGPGAKEFAEETIQSGGGSFLSELATYNALGEGFEPSVSRAAAAAAEGGVVGFASGAVAGGSGSLLRNIVNVGFAGVNQIKKAGATKLGAKDEFEVVSKNADGSFNFAGNPRTAQANLQKQGANPEKLFLDAVDTSDGKLLMGEALVYWDAMTENQRNKHEEKWKEAQRKFDNEVGFLANSTAKGLKTEKEVKKAMQDPSVIHLMRYAHSRGKITEESMKDMDPTIQGFFNVLQETENSVQEAAKAVEKANANSPNAEQVFEEKMGSNVGPKGPGLRWYVETMQSLMSNGKDAEAEYIRMDQRLASFLQSQAKKYQATREMVNRYRAGEDPAVFEAEVNQKYGTEVNWVPEDPRVKKFNEENGTNNLSGTLYFESLQIPELIKMGRVRRQLAKEAQTFMGPLKTLQDIQTLEQPTPGVRDTVVPDAGTETEAAAQGASAASDAGREAEVEGAPEASKEPVSEDDATADREADKQADREAEREAERQATQEAARSETTESRPESATEITLVINSDLYEKIKNEPFPTNFKEALALLQQLLSPVIVEMLRIRSTDQDGMLGRYLEDNEIIEVFPQQPLVTVENKTVETFVLAIMHEYMHHQIRSNFNKGSRYKVAPTNNSFDEITEEYREFLLLMKQNSIIKELAEALARKRGLKVDSLLAIEEALAEIASALESGNWEILEKRYAEYKQTAYGAPASLVNFKFPTEFKAEASTIIEQFVDLLNRLFKAALGNKDFQLSNREAIAVIRSVYYAKPEAKTAQEEQAPVEEQTDQTGQTQETRETRETQKTEQKSEVDEKAAEAAPHVQKIEKILKGMKALREKAAKGQKVAVKALIKYYEDYRKAAQPLFAARLNKYNPFSEKTDMPLYDGDLVVDSEDRVYRVSHYLPKLGNPTVLTTKRQTVYVRPSVGFDKETGKHKWGKRTTMPVNALTLHKPIAAKATEVSTNEDSKSTPHARALQEFIKDKFAQWQERIEFASGSSPRPTAEGVDEYGRYDRASKKVILYMDTIAARYPDVNEARLIAAWVTWHELHHAGFKTFANTDQKYNQFLNYAAQNAKVLELAEAIAKARKEKMAESGPRRLIYIEEALVELATAHIHRADGGFKRLKEAYGVDIKSLQGEIGKVERNWMRIIGEILQRILGKGYTKVSNKDVAKLIDVIVQQTRAIGVSEAAQATENAPSTPRASRVLQDGVPASQEDTKAARGETTYAIDPATGNQVFFNGETLLKSFRGDTMNWGPIGKKRNFKLKKMTSQEFTRYNALQKGMLVKVVFNEGKPYLMRVVMKKQLSEDSLEFTLERVDPATALETRAPREDKPNTVAKTEEVTKEEQEELEDTPPWDVDEEAPASSDTTVQPIQPIQPVQREQAEQPEQPEQVEQPPQQGTLSFGPVPDKVVEQPSEDALDQTPTEKEVEKKPEKNAEGKTIPTGELLDQLRWLVAELQVLLDPDVQANYPAGGNPTNNDQKKDLADAIQLSITRAQTMIAGRITAYGDNLTEAAEFVINDLLSVYDETILAAPESTRVDATTRAAMDTAAKIAKEGEVESLNTLENTDKVDFLSDTMVKWLAKFASGIVKWELRDKKPWSEWSKGEIAAVREALRQRFTLWGLPTKISNMFTKSKDTTTNLFNAVPNLFSMLQNRGTMMHLMRSMDANMNEAIAMRRVLNFASEFEEKFREIAFGVLNEAQDNPESHQRSIFRREGFNTDANGVEIANPLREYVVQYMMDENGNLDENMIGVMAFEVAMWMSSSGASTLGNDQRTINAILGLPEESEVGRDKDAVKIFGNGTIASQVAAQIGQKIIQNSNMKWAGNQKVAPIMQEAAVSSFGLMAIAVAQRMGYLTITPVEGKIREQLRKVRDKDGNPITLEARPLEDTTFAGSEQNINLVYLSTKGNKGKERLTPSRRNETLASAVNQSKRILGDFFGSRSYEVGPIFDGPPAAPGIIARGRTAINKALRAAIAHNSAYEWIPDRTATSLLDHFENDEFATLFMESRLSGIINVEREEGVAGKNLGNERALQQVRNHLSEHGDATFWFSYKMIRSGRIYIDSNLIDPQSIKLHRWMFAMKEWKNTMTTTDDVASEGGKSYENFLIAVGLALGVDVDKLSTEEAVQQTRDKLNEPKTKQAIQILMDPSVLQGKDGTKNKQLLADVTQSHHKGEQVHALVALQNIAAIQAAERDGKKKIDIYLPMEVDGKTNGFSASLLQTPISDEKEFEKIKQLLTATGVFFNNPKLKQQFKSFNHFVEANGTDNYESVADGTNIYAAQIRIGKIPLLQEPPSKKRTAILQKIQENTPLIRMIEAGGFLTIDRKFAKNPLMVTSYGAGMASTRRAIVQNGVDKLYEMIEEADTVEAFINVAMRYQGIVHLQKGWDWNAKVEGEIRAKWEKALKPEGALEKYRREWKMDKDGEYAFRTSLDALYGHALQAALEDKLGPLFQLRKTLNESADLMNRIFVTNFKRRVKIQEATLGREMSGRERKLLLKWMIRNNEVPLIRTPLSDHHMDSLEITSDGDVIIGRNPGNNDEGRKARAVFKKALPLRTNRWVINDDTGDGRGTYVTEPVDDVNSFTASLLGYQPDENIGVAALVKLIHSSDGAVNGQLMGRHAMLNVHDAQVGNFNKIDEIAKDANETYFNIHRDWNMATEFYNSLKNMMKLLGPQDQRLSSAEKNNILYEHAEQRVKFGDLQQEDLEQFSATQLMDEWFRNFTDLVEDIQEARKRLFREITYINQFAKDGTQWRKTGRYAPRPESLIEPTTFEEAIREVALNEGRLHEQRKAEIIERIFSEGTSLEKIKNVLTEWFEDSSEAGHSPSAADVLDVLSATLQHENTIENAIERENFRKLMSLLRPALQVYHEDPETGKSRGKPIWVRVLDKKIEDKRAFLGDRPVHFSRPQLEQGIIQINPESENIVKDLLEGFTFVASIINLEQLEQNFPEQFRDLEREMENWEKRTGRRAEGGETLRLQTLMDNRAIANGEEKGPLFKLATWLAHTTSTTTSNQQGQLRFVFRVNQVNALKNLANALTKSNGRTAFYNTGTNNLNPREFERVQGEALTVDTFRDIWQKLDSVENAKLSREDRAFLESVMERFALPGLRSVDELILKMIHKKNGDRRLGMWLNNPRNNEIWLQTTSRNYLSSNEDMTAQETLLHEILHAITAEAIGYTYKDFSTGRPVETVVTTIRQDLREELNQLYDLVLTSLVEQYGGYSNAYQAFLPNQDDLSRNSQADHEAAKRRFDHIFSEGEQNLHEFAAIAITNKQFREILSRIEDNRTEGPVFEGGIFQSIWNIMEKIIHWFRGEVIKQGETGTVDASVLRVVEKMVHAQVKHRARVSKGYDGTVFRQKLDQMDAVDLRNLAKQISGKLAPRLAQYSLSGQELREELDGANKIERLLKTARSITAKSSQGDLDLLRDHFDSAINWVRKDHWVYEMMTELLPWADRNRGWIDLLRKSESLIDMVRQQRYEHGRSSLRSFFDKKTWRNMKSYQREAITRSLLETDIGVMRRGVINVKTSQELLDILSNQTLLEAEINAMRTQLEQSVNNPDLFNLIEVQMQSLAHFMVHGEVRSPVHAMNAYIIAQQWNVPVDRRTQYSEAQQAEQEELIDKITSLMAFKRADSADVANMLEIMQDEMLRPVQVNGFNGVLGMHDQFVDLSNKYLFESGTEKAHMIKGFTSTITDPEVDVQIVVDDPLYTAKWEAAGYIRDASLARDGRERERPNMVLYYKKKGIAGYVKSIVSITNETNRGTGVFDSFFQVTSPETQDPSLTAARAYNHIAKLRTRTYNAANHIMNGSRVRDEVYMAPLWNHNGEMVDYRYMMNKDLQRKILKKRDLFDEVLPRMLGTIEDKRNTKAINREVVDKLYQEYSTWRKADPKSYEREDYRFVEIGADVATEEGREMWRLLPEDTKHAARAAFGADVLYVRDDAVNLILGFRKIAWSDNKFLGKYAPVVDVAEKIWLEIIKWVRFRIAVLTPEVVIGNLLSNWSLLLSRGIPPQYIIRESYKAIKAMNLYQKDLRRFNELNNKINAMEREGLDTRQARNQLARLEQGLNTSVVAPLVEEGMFTSIVEDFGSDQDSLRRKATAKILDKFGGFVGVHQAVRVTEEAFMVPESEFGRAAIKATQYGDFVGRFVQYNWQTQVGRKQKQLTPEMEDEIRDLRLAQDTWEQELLKGPGHIRALDLRDNINRAEQAIHKIIRSAPTVRVKSDPRDAVHDALSTFIYYNIPQNRWLQFANDNGFMMFTKFFFRIQHIMARVIKENPVSAVGMIAGQHALSSMLDSRTIGENIFNYGGLSGITRKFTFTPWEHAWNIDLLKPTFLKWIPDVFYEN
jgi:hypothetical protein